MRDENNERIELIIVILICALFLFKFVVKIAQ
jgi:hypothetical protein